MLYKYSLVISVIVFIGLVSLPNTSYGNTQVEPAKRKRIILSQVRNVGPNDCAYKTLNQAYSSIGYQLDFTILPAKRALIESNAGRTDGETARIQFLENSYPNLVRVPVAICHMKQQLFGLKSNEKLNDATLGSLKLGIINGSVFVEQLYSQQNLVKAINNKQLLKLLLKGRVDVVSMPNQTLEKLATEEQIAQLINFKSFSPTIPLFHYLHKKHSDLVPQITQALEELERSGFIADAIKNHAP